MRIEKASTHSTSSPQPGEKTRTWLQNQDLDIVRTWIQLRHVYNNGNVDYDAEYRSGVGTEESLAFYSTVADELLIALSAQYPSSTWSLPEGDAYVDFIRETLIHYKTKFPKIKYVQVGNEPRHAGQTMSCPEGDEEACTPPSRQYYYPMYQAYYQAISEVNAELGLEDDPILISNGAFTGNLARMLDYAHEFFAAYAADPNLEKKFDVFSFHSYGETGDPFELEDARRRIHAAMESHGLPAVPIFVTEYGMLGGSPLPSGKTLAETVTMQPAAMLTKAFYLYEGGINAVFNWSIHHATLTHKSQIADLENAYAYPYGQALVLAQEVSDRQTRIEATSNNIYMGLGTHVLASMKSGEGIAVLVWNYNWISDAPEDEFNVLVKNIPQSEFDGGKMHSSIYIIDSDKNNYFTNTGQTTLQVTEEEDLDYSSSLTIPLQLEKNAVALVLLTPAR